MVEVYVGLDVSDKSTHLCVVDGSGAIMWSGACATDPETRDTYDFRTNIAAKPARERKRPERCARRSVLNLRSIGATITA